MKRVAALLLAAASAAAGQTLVFRDGRTLPIGDVQFRDGAIVVTVTSGASSIERTFPLADLDRVEAPRPLELGRAEEQVGRGDAAGAVETLEPVLRTYEPVRGVRGSWWPDAARTRARALAQLGREIDLAVLLRRMEGLPNAPFLPYEGRIALAEAQAARGDIDGSNATLEELLGESVPAEVAARAWLQRGDILRARRDLEGALLAYLRVVAFHGRVDAVQPAALARAAAVFEERGETERATALYLDILSDHPQAPEAQIARAKVQAADPSLSP